MNIEKLLWYKNRLCSMSFMEIFYRAGEQIKRKISKYYTPKFNLNIRGFPLYFDIPNSNLIDAEDAYKNIKNGEFKALGLNWKLNKDKWRKDPVNGNLWDNKSYCFDIDYKYSDKFGDVKYIWEINRLQHLQKIAVHGGKEEFCISELMDWIDKNPPFYGIVWASGIELALRVVSILVITSTFGEDAFTDEQKHKINNCLSAHSYWLYRFPSKYSSANNHLVAEAGGLYLLGVLAPYLPNAMKYKEYGYDMLCQEITNQIHPDGVGAEQSISYTQFSLEWFEICGKIAKVMCEDFPPTYWDRIKKCKEWLDCLTDKNGNIIQIGDNDEGVVFAVDL